MRKNQAHTGKDDAVLDQATRSLRLRIAQELGASAAYLPAGGSAAYRNAGRGRPAPLTFTLPSVHVPGFCAAAPGAIPGGGLRYQGDVRLVLKPGQPQAPGVAFGAADLQEGRLSALDSAADALCAARMSGRGPQPRLESLLAARRRARAEAALRALGVPVRIADDHDGSAS